MTLLSWVGWGLILILQNISFTIVSRARNSASLKKHLVAGLLSNGVWFLSQLWIIQIAMDVLSGKFGLPMQIFAVVYYASATMFGSLAAHWWSLRTEKGKTAVGASNKYAQIPKEEWEKVKQLLENK